jgi:hypothetical protein
MGAGIVVMSTVASFASGGCDGEVQLANPRQAAAISERRILTPNQTLGDATRFASLTSHAISSWKGARIEPPYHLVPHSWSTITRVVADRYFEDTAGFVFENASTAGEIDLWPLWDDSPWFFWTEAELSSESLFARLVERPVVMKGRVS